MEVTFASKRLHDCYLSFAEGSRVWSPMVARKYIQAITILAQAETLAQVSPIRRLRLHRLHGPRDGQLAVDLHGRWRLCFTVDGTRVRIEEVSNHYDD
jgi:plasmid maintenance system killer protein